MQMSAPHPRDSGSADACQKGRFGQTSDTRKPNLYCVGSGDCHPTVRNTVRKEGERFLCGPAIFCFRHHFAWFACQLYDWLIDRLFLFIYFCLHSATSVWRIKDIHFNLVLSTARYSHHRLAPLIPTIIQITFISRIFCHLRLHKGDFILCFIFLLSHSWQCNAWLFCLSVV